MPLTFRLINKLRIEIELFASFASRAAELRRAGPPTVEERTDAFAECLEEWLDLRWDAHVLIWDLLRHELALAALRAHVAAHPSLANAARCAISRFDSRLFLR